MCDLQRLHIMKDPLAEIHKAKDLGEALRGEDLQVQRI